MVDHVPERRAHGYAQVGGPLDARTGHRDHAFNQRLSNGEVVAQERHVSTLETRVSTSSGSFPDGTSRASTAAINIFSAPWGYLTGVG